MQELDMDISLKVIVVGNGCCGKSSLLQRFTKGSMPVTHRKTVGTEFMEKTIELHDTDEHVQLLLWDTAGGCMRSATNTCQRVDD
jgi:small GTP-binding protein